MLDSWPRWLAVAAVAPFAYGAMVVILRIGGKRTLSKLNAFDFTVTIALGSLLASVVVSPSVSLASGIVAIVMLVGLQAMVTAATARWSPLQRILKSPPSAVVVDGQIVESARVRHRLTDSELRQALRKRGVSSLDGVRLVVLETDGTLTVLTDPDALEGWATQDIEH